MLLMKAFSNVIIAMFRNICMSICINCTCIKWLYIQIFFFFSSVRLVKFFFILFLLYLLFFFSRKFMLLIGEINKLVRPRWPYDMRPSALAEKYMCVIVIR